MQDGDSFAGGTYPEPPEIEEQHVKSRVTISFTIEYDCPKKWDREDIIQDIKDNLDDFTWFDEKIEDIDV